MVDEGTSHTGIVARNVTKAFGSFRALRGVSLSVAPGTCTALFGPNGAGKSTLLGVISTLIRPTSGTVTVGGVDVLEDGSAARGKIGVVSHHTWTYDKLTVHDNLIFFARLHGVPTENATRLEEELGLTSVRNKDAGALSRGMKQRLSLARALLHDPAVLLLDEPFTGLDVSSASLLTARLASLRDEGRTALLVTHSVEQGWRVADNAVLMVRGAVVHEERTVSDGCAAFENALAAAGKGTSL